MKVLQINSVCGIRSTGKICTDLADVLKEQGHDSLVLYGRENAPLEFDSISKKITTDTEVKLHALSARLFDNAGFASNMATERFISEIEKYNPDIIHLHNLHGYYINVEMLFEYLKSQSRPVVWTLHDCWAFTGHCAHYSFVGCDRWKYGCYGCPQSSQYPKSIVDCSKRNYEKKRTAFSGVKKMMLITPSEWLRQQLSESFLAEYSVSVIPNGIDLAAFKPTHADIRKKYGIGEGKIILGVASAWSERKGLSDFVRLTELLVDEYKIVLVGIKDSTALPKKIITIPRTDSREELAAIYTAAYAFYNPSREETMGLTTAEAMACGAPVIAYNLTAISEVVGDGGLIAPIASAEAVLPLLDKIGDIRRDKCVAKATEYDKNIQFKKYLKIYEELMK